MTLRQYHVLQYAEYLHSDPALWRITVDYMRACGEIGTYRADEVLLRVPLGFSNYSQPTGPDLSGKRPTSGDDRIMDSEDEASRIRAGDIVGVLKEVNQCCFEHGREGVRRMVCRVSVTPKLILPRVFSRNPSQIAGKALMNEKQYGLAISYYTSAEDWPGLGRVIDQVLSEYITQGPAKFTSLVAEIAPSLQMLRSTADSSDYPMHGIFLHRLMFIVKYAEFHQRKMSNDLVEAAADLISMFEDDIAPTSWWGVLLQDSVEFLNYREFRLALDPERARLSVFCVSGWYALHINQHRTVAPKNGGSTHANLAGVRGRLPIGPCQDHPIEWWERDWGRERSTK